MKWSLAHGARVALTLIVLSSAASPASADWLLTPYLGVVFGGAANTVDIDDFSDTFEQGQLRFDYRMRDGVVRTSNALALMRSIGLAVEGDDVRPPRSHKDHGERTESLRG